MKIFCLFIVGLFLITVLGIPATAQTEKSKTDTFGHVVAVNTKAFEEEKSGIRDLVIAYDQLETELTPQKNELQVLSVEFQKLQGEISEYVEALKKDRIGCGNLYSKAKAKFEEYNKLGGEFKVKTNDYKSLYEKRKSEIVTPIINKIGNALKLFAKQNGYMMILNSSQNNSSAIIEEEPIDITKEFIQFYNDYSEKEKTQ